MSSEGPPSVASSWCSLDEVLEAGEEGCSSWGCGVAADLRIDEVGF